MREGVGGREGDGGSRWVFEILKDLINSYFNMKFKHAHGVKNVSSKNQNCNHKTKISQE